METLSLSLAEILPSDLDALWAAYEGVCGLFIPARMEAR